MPAGLYGSRNYIWYTSTDSCLGVGATGSVYKCRHKKSGDLHAVKTFNSTSQLRPMDVQMREFDLLKKLNHENIVKLLAVEEEERTKSKVIIMELCTGGSLYNVLSDPENMYGLAEDEFLSVLHDVSEGIKYLREQSIIHRDIKPGNIMLYINDEGKIIYKLADFGAARELQDEEEFVSLFGTEEFLHPDMYKRAVMRQDAPNPFRATVDLWSLGVTFYQAATGQLPFRPYGGRRNKDTMYYITSEKPSGVISGVQHSENGDIEWDKNLPKTCRFSGGLQAMLTPLIAGLLEQKQDETWGFSKFFTEVTDILHRKIVYVFIFNSCILLHVYIDGKDNLAKFQELLAEQTDIPARSQLLIFNKQLFSEHISGMQALDSYPESTPNQPLILFSDDYTELTKLSSPYIPILPKFARTSVINLPDDASVAKHYCTIMHHIDREIRNLETNWKLLYLATNSMQHIVQQQLEKLHKHVQDFDKLFSETKHRDSVMAESNKHTKTFLQFLKKYITTHSWENQVPKLEEYINDNQLSLKSLDNKVQKLKEFLSKIEKKYGKRIECDMKNIETPSPRVRKIKEIKKLAKTKMDEFKRDRNLKTLDYNEEQIHKLERARTSQQMDKAKHYFESFVNELQDLHCRLANPWFYYTCECRKQCKTADTYLAELHDKQESLSIQMEKNSISYNECLSVIRNDVESRKKSHDGFSESRRLNKEKNAKMMDELKNGVKSLSLDTKEARKVATENLQLTDKLGELMKNDNPTALRLPHLEDD